MSSSYQISQPSAVLKNSVNQSDSKVARSTMRMSADQTPVKKTESGTSSAAGFSSTKYIS
jgi:hypothetical protein